MQTALNSYAVKKQIHGNLREIIDFHLTLFHLYGKSYYDENANQITFIDFFQASSVL